MLFITPAFAQAAPAAGGAGFLMQLLPFVMILGIMYFLIIRPQQNKLKEHRAMIASVKRGDTIITSGGIVGKVTRMIGNDELQVEIAEGVKVRIVRSTVADVRIRGDVRDAEARKALAHADNDDHDDVSDTTDGVVKPVNRDRTASTDV